MSHNMFIDTERGLLYVCGSLAPYEEGMRIYSLLEDPVNPTFLGHWSESYVHDVHAVGDRAFVFLGKNGAAVLDVSDPTMPVLVQEFDYPELAYCHSGWLSPDGKYLAINDEFAEMEGLVDRTTIYFFEHDPVTDQFVPRSRYLGPNDAIDHNIFWKDNYCYVSNYAYGLTILDMSVIDAPLLVAKYDTFQLGIAPYLIGAWGVYPFLPSGNILVSDIHTGLYVFEHVPGRDDLLAFHLREYGFDPLDPNAFAPLPATRLWGPLFLGVLLCALSWRVMRRRGAV